MQRNILKKLLVSTVFALSAFASFSQSAAINTDGSSAVASAMLEVKSTTKGFLPPRMTELERNAIVSPVAGLTVWCSDCPTAGQMQVYNGTAWTNMTGGAATSGIAPIVTICSQVWMQKNLEVTTYRNGDPIPQVTDPTAWSNLTTGAWCYYNNSSANGPVYGKLYNWFAVNDPRGLAPTGFHIPTDAEWSTLVTCLGGGSLAGGAMKQTGTAPTALWLSPNTGATNSSGFTGVPGGFRQNIGSFGGLGESGQMWSTLSAGSTAFYRFLYFGDATLYRFDDQQSAGFSVRCIKD